MFNWVIARWYRLELRLINSMISTYEKFKDDPNKDADVRLNSAVLLTELLAKRDTLNKKLELA
jgi:hypothetical protein